jgi:hypothetical protein
VVAGKGRAWRAVGKLAMVVLNKNLLTVEAAMAMKDIKVLERIKEGKPIFTEK